MARLLADEHVMPGVIRRLGLLGHEVGTVRSLITESKLGQSVTDAQVLEFASDHKYAVVTKNVRHFRNLHRSSGDHFGIIACVYDDQGDSDQIGRAIHEEIGKLRALRGKFVTVIVEA